VELNESLAFSELIGSRVRDQSGRSLGRVFEARGHNERDGVVVIDELMLGRSALWQRLRGPAANARSIPWASVIDAGDGEIVVSH
jgi:sporulation protein YlmC with PRC-barrel domain